MPNLVINKVFFKIINPVIPIWISAEDFFGGKKKNSVLFEGIVDPEMIHKNDIFYYSFQVASTATEYSINLANKKYFIKPYITSKLKNYFENKG